MLSGLFTAITDRNRLLWFGRRAGGDVLITAVDTALVIARTNTVGCDLRVDMVGVHIAGVPHAGTRIVRVVW